jgi:hypothetical protein
VKKASDLIPWKVTDISLRPFDHFWSMNPSIHYDGTLWRCVLRCSDYSMPGGVAIRSGRARPGESRTKNAMVIFDPVSWTPVEIYKMRERDELSRASSTSVGYEDIRIFRTDKGGLQGIAASLHLKRPDRGSQLAEQVLLRFDEEYNIVDAHPIRGDSWSRSPQKNWVPFDGCAEPRFLYSIDKGTMFNDRGEIRAAEALVRPSTRPRSRSHEPDERAMVRARERAREREGARAREEQRCARRARDDRSVELFCDTKDLPALEGLRGGTQLVRVGEDAWLGIGHDMKFVDNLKMYWHVWYLVDARGKMKSASPPMKLAPDNGIEFAAGMGIDGERVVVSFGVDDMECKIGETKLSAVMATLQKVGR